MSSELKLKTIRAVGWNFIEALGVRCLQFVFGIILARILLPEQFGLIGMLMICIAVGQTLLDSGFGAALIQKHLITEKDINSIFYFNIFISIVIVAGLFALSSLIAFFYHQPILSPLLKILSVTLIIDAIGLVPNVLLIKSIDFKTQTLVTFVASILSGIVGISMAYRGYGVWSLAGQQISYSIFRTLLLWVLSSWRPAWVLSFQSLRELFGFGSKLLAAKLLGALFDNIYLVVIGKMFPLADLGNFTMAREIQRAPMTTLSHVISKVTFPVFSTIQDESERIKRGVKKTLILLMFIHFPIMLGLVVIARPLVLLVLTAKWLPCVPYLQLLCFVGVMYPIHNINLNVLKVMGRSNLLLRLEIIKKTLIVLNIFITYRWGISAMIYGHIITSFLSYYLNAYYTKKLINYSLFEQIRDLYPYLLAATFTAVFVYALSYFPLGSSLLLLLSQIVIGTVVYFTVCKIFKLSSYLEIKQIISEKIQLPNGF